MMKRKTAIFVICLVVVFGVLIWWQYNLYQKLSKTDMSCEGDWSYDVKCPVGTYCHSLGQGPMAGGLCKPLLSPMFESLTGQER